MSRVLITCAGSATGMNLFKALSKDHYVFMCDSNPQIEAMYRSEQFQTVPRCNDMDYLDSMVRLCSKLEVDYLFPLFDPEFSTLRRQNHDIEYFPSTKLILPSCPTITLCDDKQSTVKAFQKAGVNTPPESCIYPCVVRPRFGGRGSIGTSVCHSGFERLLAESELQSPFVTSFKEGQEVTVDVLCSEQHQVLSMSIRDRVETKAGVATKSRLHHENYDDVLIKIKAIAQHFQLQYINCIQAIRDPEGTYWWFEVNPRYGGGSAATQAAGLNLPILLLHHLNGDQINWEKETYKDGICIRSYHEHFQANP